MSVMSRKTLKSWTGAWNRFWFEADHAQPLRLFRVVFSIFLITLYLVRSIDLELFYSNQGLVHSSIVPELMPMEFRHSLFEVFTGMGAIWAFNLLFLATLVLLMLGIMPRVAALVAVVIHVSFIRRNMAVAYGADLVSTYFLLYLCLASYDAKAKSALGSLALRLCQVQVCVIYAYSGLEKIKGPAWYRGEAMWNVLGNWEIARWDFSWVGSVPLLVVGVTYATILWETYFPVLIWIKALRYPMLILGVFLHLGIAVAISLPFFATLMVLTYSVFLEPRLAERILRKGGSFFLKLAPRSPMS